MESPVFVQKQSLARDFNTHLPYVGVAIANYSSFTTNKSHSLTFFDSRLKSTYAALMNYNLKPRHPSPHQCLRTELRTSLTDSTTRCSKDQRYKSLVSDPPKDIRRVELMKTGSLWEPPSTHTNNSAHHHRVPNRRLPRPYRHLSSSRSSSRSSRSSIVLKVLLKSRNIYRNAIYASVNPRYVRTLFHEPSEHTA
jgi:hypothetical protein